MAAAYPDLFETARAAETALQRENPTQTPIDIFLIGVCVGFLSVGYRRTGSRGPAARLLFDPARVDPAAWLAERIGDVTILGEAEPVEAERAEADAAPAEPPPEQATQIEPPGDVEPPVASADTEPSWLDAVAIAEPTPSPVRPIAWGSIGIGELFMIAGIRSPPGAWHCTWIVDARVERIRRCSEMALDGLGKCAKHRRQYAETLLADPPSVLPAEE